MSAEQEPKMGGNGAVCSCDRLAGFGLFLIPVAFWVGVSRVWVDLCVVLINFVE